MDRSSLSQHSDETESLSSTEGDREVVVIESSDEEDIRVIESNSPGRPGNFSSGNLVSTVPSITEPDIETRVNNSHGMTERESTQEGPQVILHQGPQEGFHQGPQGGIATVGGGEVHAGPDNSVCVAGVSHNTSHGATQSRVQPNIPEDSIDGLRIRLAVNKGDPNQPYTIIRGGVERNTAQNGVPRSGVSLNTARPNDALCRSLSDQRETSSVVTSPTVITYSPYSPAQLRLNAIDDANGVSNVGPVLPRSPETSGRIRIQSDFLGGAWVDPLHMHDSPPLLIFPPNTISQVNRDDNPIMHSTPAPASQQNEPRPPNSTLNSGGSPNRRITIAGTGMMMSQSYRHSQQNTSENTDLNTNINTTTMSMTQNTQQNTFDSIASTNEQHTHEQHTHGSNHHMNTATCQNTQLYPIFPSLPFNQQSTSAHPATSFRGQNLIAHTMLSTMLSSVTSDDSVTNPPRAITSQMNPPAPTATPELLLTSGDISILASFASESLNELSQGNFQSLKRRRSPSPKSGKKINDDEDEACPICLEEWTTTGAHRLVSLKCGHLFGQKCILKWLLNKKSCPQCNARARRMDLRYIYTSKIKVLDTSERDEALVNLERERTLRGKAEMKNAEIQLQHRLKTEECEQLRVQLAAYRASTAVINKPDPLVNSAPPNTGVYSLEHTLLINDGGGCRVCAYSHSLAAIVVSQVRTNSLFPGYGFKKLGCLDYKNSCNLTIHSKPIRDACFRGNDLNGILLSCSMDKTLKLTNVHTNNILQTYDTALPAWSCTYNVTDNNLFYAGLMNGVVLEYDIRNTSESVRKLCVQGSTAPVVSLQHVPASYHSTFRSSGLLVGQLDKITFYEKSGEDFRPHFMPLEGTMTSLSFEPVTRHFLASFRPTGKYPNSRHVLCELTSQELNGEPSQVFCGANMIHTFHGGPIQKLLSRSTIVARGNDPSRVTAFTSDEMTKSTSVWDVGTLSFTQKLTNHQRPVLDVCAFTRDQFDFLATLTERSLRIYKTPVPPLSL